MNNNIMILTDSRQQKENHIIRAFDRANIFHLQTKLDTADYMLLKYTTDTGFNKDYTTLIDTKKDLIELAGNLCSKDHDRVKREVELASTLGCKEFIFLVGVKKGFTTEDLKTWKNPRGMTTGARLIKTMATFKKNRKEELGIDVRFMFCYKREMGDKVIELLGGEKNGFMD